MNKFLRKLGVVSVSALMLLGVGAGMSNAQHPVHADNIAAEGAAQDRRYDDYLFGGPAGVKAYEESMAKRDVEYGENPYDDGAVTMDHMVSHNQIAKIIRQTKQDNQASSSSSDASTSSASASDNAVAPASASSAPASASTDDVPAMPAITTGGTPEAKTQHKVTMHKSHSRKARPVMKPRVRRHHARKHARVAKFSHKKVNRSLKHDTVYVNRVSHKRHVRKNVAKRLRNVKRHARRTNKRSKRVNLQREIKSLKRQLKRARSWRTRRSIRHQLSKLTKQYANMFGKRANNRNHKINKRAYRHTHKHAKRNKRSHALKYNGYRE